MGEDLGMPKRIYTVQTYISTDREWIDGGSYPTITEAVSKYKWNRNEYPDAEFRIIQILEVE